MLDVGGAVHFNIYSFTVIATLRNPTLTRSLVTLDTRYNAYQARSLTSLAMLLSLKRRRQILVEHHLTIATPPRMIQRPLQVIQQIHDRV